MSRAHKSKPPLCENCRTVLVEDNRMMLIVYTDLELEYHSKELRRYRYKIIQTIKNLRHVMGVYIRKEGEVKL